MPHELDARDAPKHLTPQVIDAFAGLIAAVEYGSGIEVAGCLAQLVNTLIENRDARPQVRDQALARAVERLGA